MVRPVSPARQIHAGFNLATLERLICVKAE